MRKHMSQPKMKDRDFILLVIATCQDSEEFGRTSLQKVAYLAGEILHRNLGHRPHYFGPYSPALEQEVETLVLSGYIQEKLIPLGFTGSGGFEGRKYEYRVTAHGMTRLKAVKEAHPIERQRLEAVIRAIEEAAGGFDQRVLSPAAKTLYITMNEKRPLSAHKIRDLAKDLGWTLSSSQVTRVATVLERLDLISRSN